MTEGAYENAMMVRPRREEAFEMDYDRAMGASSKIEPNSREADEFFGQRLAILARRSNTRRIARRARASRQLMDEPR